MPHVEVDLLIRVPDDLDDDTKQAIHDAVCAQIEDYLPDREVLAWTKIRTDPDS